MNTKFKLIAAFVIVLFIGVTAGVTGTRIAYRNILGKALDRPSLLSTRIEGSLDGLSLSPEQNKKIREILAESREQGQALRNDFRPRLWTILTDTRQRIVAELTPEQQREFRKAVRDELPLLQQVIENRRGDPDR